MGRSGFDLNVPPGIHWRMVGDRARLQPASADIDGGTPFIQSAAIEIEQVVSHVNGKLSK
jgi:hypothetical protein